MTAKIVDMRQYNIAWENFCEYCLQKTPVNYHITISDIGKTINQELKIFNAVELESGIRYNSDTGNIILFNLVNFASDDDFITFLLTWFY